MGHRITAGPGASLPCSGGSWAAWLMGKAGTWSTCQPSRCGRCPRRWQTCQGLGETSKSGGLAVGKACLWAPCVRRLLTEGCSKAHWAHIFSSQPDWSPGHTNRASPPGGEGPTIQRSLGHRMPSEPESATLLGCGYEGQGHSGSKACPSPCCP